MKTSSRKVHLSAQLAEATNKWHGVSSILPAPDIYGRFHSRPDVFGGSAIVPASSVSNASTTLSNL